MIDCKKCDRELVCKYSQSAPKEDTFKVSFPFTVDVQCEYFKEYSLVTKQVERENNWTTAPSTTAETNWLTAPSTTFSTKAKLTACYTCGYWDYLTDECKAPSNSIIEFPCRKNISCTMESSSDKRL